MGISFQQPSLLFLLFLAGLLIVWFWRNQNRVSGIRLYAILIIRIVFFLSLILSLAKIEILFPIQGETVVFVVDRSASMKQDQQVVAFLEEAVAAKKPEDRYSIISIGAEAKIEQPITTSKDLTPIGTIVNVHATNLAAGIRLASGMIPNKIGGKIVLITDGLENQGDMLNEVRYSKEQEIIIDAYSIQHEVEDEVLISSLQIPNTMHLNEQFTGDVVLNSTVSTKGTLYFYENNQEIAQHNINIEKGENSFSFTQTVTKEGFHKFRVELMAETDTVRLNNQAYAYTQVSTTPKILIVEGHSGAADNLVNALHAGDVIVEVKDPSGMPQKLEDYKQYSTIILADVQATQLSNEDMNRLHTSVRDIGLGLIMTGGNDSFGLGGWFKTPIEDALPVYMDIKNKEEIPSLGLILVIDKSGSMEAGMGGYSKVELAKEAALRATDMLTPKDQIGVIAFDNEPWTVVEPQATENLSEIQNKISGIYASGGTDIFPAMQLAYEKLNKLNTKRKHIILLTDGRSANNGDYEGLVKEMADKKITVSTVAVGEDADVFLLEELAKMGKGRYYFSNDPSTIPKIFSKETALASKTFIVDKPHVPSNFTLKEWTFLQNNLPILNSYIATTPKQTAELSLISIDQDPILTRWQYGLGRSVAWTSDLEGKWSPQWVSWNQYSQLWDQIVGWTFPRTNEKKWNVETYLNGINGMITVKIPGGEIPQQMEAIIINESLGREVIKLKAIAPGTLQGTFTTKESGTHLIQVIQKEKGQIISSQTEGLNVAYSPEYNILESGEEKLRDLVTVSGGNLITDPKQVFQDEQPNAWEHQDISKLLLLLATILWPIDIGLRRVNFPNTVLDKLKSNNNNKNNNKNNLVIKEKITVHRKITEEKRENYKPDTDSTNSPGSTNEAMLQRLLETKRKNNK